MSKRNEIKAAIESVRNGSEREARVLCPGGSASSVTYRRTPRGIVRDAYGPDGQDYGSRLIEATPGVEVVS